MDKEIAVRVAMLCFLLAAILWTAFLVSELRFLLPIKWRLKSPRWDKFLCKIGSHRCINICGRGCCWECIRCTP